MKKIVVVLVSLVVAVLIGVGNAFAHIPEPSLGPEWKFLARGFSGTTLYLNTSRISHLPKGIVKVRTLVVPRGELRREDVNFLKKDLTSKGKDPKNAERLWYEILLYKVNCEKHQFAMLEFDDYSFEKTVIGHISFQDEEWKDIPPGSEFVIVEKRVCNKTSLSIPEPSLGPEWKLTAIDLDGTTVYVNTSRITHLPNGIVKVWTLWVPKGEDRRGQVNGLKNDLLFKRKDPKNAERLWYIISLLKFNCKPHKVAYLEDIAYSFGQAVLDHQSFQHEKWDYIVPGSVDEAIENYVCKKRK